MLFRSEVPFAVVTHPSLPVNTVKELVAYARARPGELAYASSGTGSVGHLAGVLFETMTGTKMLHVPYKGGAPALIETTAGQAQLTMGSLIQTTTFIRANKLRAIAISTSTRSSVLPNLPTVAESGVPGYHTANWWGVAAPHGTPAAIVNRVNAEIKAVLQTPEMEKRLVNEGAEPQVKTPAELGKYVTDEMKKWVELARIADIRAE